MLQILSTDSLHLPNAIVHLCILRQSVDFGRRELEHALFARLRGQLLADQHELLRGELGFAFDFLEELLEFLVGDCHFVCWTVCVLVVCRWFNCLDCCSFNAIDDPPRLVYTSGNFLVPLHLDHMLILDSV
jgi:hypothetical protein